MGGCSCFALGQKQVKREKEQKSAILLFIDWIPDTPQYCGVYSLCAGRQGLAQGGRRRPLGWGPQTQETFHGNVPVLLLHWDAAWERGTRHCTEGQGSPSVW